MANTTDPESKTHAALWRAGIGVRNDVCSVPMSRTSLLLSVGCMVWLRPATSTPQDDERTNGSSIEFAELA